MTTNSAHMTIRHIPQDAAPGDEGIVIAHRPVELDTIVYTLHSVHRDLDARSKPALVTDFSEDGKSITIVIEPSQDAPPLQEGLKPAGTYRYYFEALTTAADLSLFHDRVVSLVASWIEENPNFAASDKIRQAAAPFFKVRS